MKANEINAKYLVLHDALGTRKDAKDKELFDQEHRQVWHDCDLELQARKAELVSSGELAPEEMEELRVLESLFPPEPPPHPGLVRARELLEDIPMLGQNPNLAELLDLLVKRLR